MVIGISYSVDHAPNPVSKENLLALSFLVLCSLSIFFVAAIKDILK